MEGDDLVAIIHVASTALVGSVLVAAGLRGFAFSMLSMPSRVLIAVGGALLIMPSLVTELVGLALAVVGLALSSVSIPGLAPARKQDV